MIILNYVLMQGSDFFNLKHNINIKSQCCLLLYSFFEGNELERSLELEKNNKEM